MSCQPLAAALKQDLPEVESVVRFRDFGDPVLRHGDKAFSEEKFYWADSSFFNVFTVHFIKGNPVTALTQPNSVVITEEMAHKYFGNINPMGKILNADRRRDYIVTGVVEKFPDDSHFHFDFLGSLNSYNDRNTVWFSNNYYTYVVLKDGTDPAAFEKKMNEDVRKYIGPQINQATGITFEQFEAAGNKVGFYLQPLTSIHLHSHLDYEIEANSDIAYVWVFSAIAVMILLIACFNFMNLSTARSERRAKEVGIRKTLGSNRGRLIAQFITESTLMSMFSVFFALILVWIFLPIFNDISGKQLSVGLFDNFYTIPLIVAFALIVGLLSGSYPALYLSSFMPMHVLKSDGKRKGRKSILRSVLVISQFVVSIILIVSTIIIYNQLSFVQNKNLGFNKEQVIIINKTDDIGKDIESFKHDLLSNPKVLAVSNSTDIPGHQTGDDVLQPENGSTEDARNILVMATDFGFVNTYQIKMADGRFFSKDFATDSTGVILNETAVKSFGMKNPVGKNLTALRGNGNSTPPIPIIGVMKDFNVESLHQTIRPLAVYLFGKNGFGKFTSVRIAPSNYQATIDFLRNTWKKYAGNQAFNYNFLDQNLDRLYNADIRASKLAITFTILAIFVACLGLLGLAAFITEQRTKEIGIRKVLGASVPEVVRLLSSEFARWVLIANIIAWPVAYYAMNKWLQDFAYKIDIGIWVFVLAGIAALFIALATVSYHAVKAAVANPVEALRYE